MGQPTTTQTFNGRKRVRKFFGHIREVAEMPNLIEVQKASYDQFLLVDEPQGGRPDEGLQSVFKSVFPIADFANTSLLEFVKYEFEPPKYDVDECRQRGMTFAAPLKVTLRLIVFDVDPDTGAKSVKDIKEQDVYMGDMPFMTTNGTFIVNGTERVIVSQMHRSPGVFFDHDKGKTPFIRQAPVRRPHHSLSRLLARHRVRRQGHHLRTHRPAPENSGDVAVLCARHGRRGSAQHLLQDGRLFAARRGLARAVRRRAHEGHEGERRLDRCRYRRGGARSRQEDDRAHGAPARREGPEVHQGAGRRPLWPVYRRRHHQPVDRRNLRRGGRRDHEPRRCPYSSRRGSTNCRFSTSTTSTSAPISATRWPSTRTRRARRRCSTSTA